MVVAARRWSTLQTGLGAGFAGGAFEGEVFAGGAFAWDVGVWGAFAWDECTWDAGAWEADEAGLTCAAVGPMSARAPTRRDR